MHAAWMRESLFQGLYTYAGGSLKGAIFWFLLLLLLLLSLLRWYPRFAFLVRALTLCACLCAGIRVLLACFTRRPCAGRHLLFFAAAKKSRQKKAANTASA
ncbi:hypothetical protein [Paraburkholderia terrae]|uniref:hypothetical protein n=1 Tax=Paraburkholderia terrae TaxID=311230 RepID=UPI003365B1A6